MNMLKHKLPLERLAEHILSRVSYRSLPLSLSLLRAQFPHEHVVELRNRILSGK
jgi:hypothetical protein